MIGDPLDGMSMCIHVGRRTGQPGDPYVSDHNRPTEPAFSYKGNPEENQATKITAKAIHSPSIVTVLDHDQLATQIFIHSLTVRAPRQTRPQTQQPRQPRSTSTRTTAQPRAQARASSVPRR